MKRTGLGLKISVVFLGVITILGLLASSVDEEEHHNSTSMDIITSTLSVDWTVVGPDSYPGMSIWCEGEYVYCVHQVWNASGHEDFEIQKYWKNNGTFITEFVYSTANDDVVKDIWINGTHMYTCGTSGTSMLVVKWDLAGNIIWDSIFESNVYSGNAIFGNNDSLYTCGFKQTASNYGILSKLYANGSVEWTQTISSDYNGARDVWCNESGVYLLLYESSNLYLSRWHSNGTMDWEHSFPSSSNRPDSIWADGGFIYAAYQYSNDIYLRKYNTSGNLEWERSWDSGNYDFGSTVWVDAKFIYIGGYTSASQFGSDPTPVLVKYKLNGDFNHSISDRVNPSRYSYINDIYGMDDTIYTTGGSDINGFSEYIFVRSFHTIIPPDAPLLASIPEDTDGDYVVNWTDVGNADTYHLFRDEEFITNVDALSPIYSGNVSEYSEAGISPGVYYYVVVAANATLGSSDPSNCIAVNVTGTLEAPVIEPIDSPNNIGNIWVNWSEPAGATFYELYRDTSPITATEGMVPVYNGSSASFNDTGLGFDLYYYTVIARNATEQSPLSDLVSVSVEDVPGKPTLDALASPDYDGSFWVNWQPQGGATSYDLYRNTTTITTTVGLTPIYSGSSTSYYQTGLGIGEYFYALVAKNASGSSELSDSVSINCSVPSAPSNITFGPMNMAGEFQVSWNPSIGASGYKLFRDTSNITNVSLLTPIYMGSSPSYTESSLGAGTYFYCVVAYDPLGDSGPSNCEFTTLSFPGNVTLDPIPSPNIGGNYTVNWSVASGGVLYLLYRSPSFITNVSSLTPIYNGSNTQHDLVKDSVGIHYYVVVAWNPIGYSNLSNCEQVTVDHLPEAPVLNQVNSPDVDGNYTISWSSVANAERYFLFRSPGSIDNVSGLTPIYNGTEIFYQESVVSWSTNFYVVVAWNATGNSSLSNNIEVVSGPIEHVSFNDNSLFGLNQSAPVGISNVHAILVGISDYAGFFNDLQYCDDDVWDMRSFLVNYYHVPLENIITLVNTQATNASIHNAISTVAANMTVNDTFFFYFSGHGGGQIGGGGLNTISTSVGYIPVTIHEPGAARMRVNMQNVASYETVYIGDAKYGGVYDIMAGENGWSDWVYTDDIMIYCDVGDSCTILQVEWDNYVPPFEIYSTDLIGIQTSHLDLLLDDVPGNTICMLDACHSGGFVSGIA
ncbi:MAG: caspase family protein, partial [Candidatus Hodarchaeota archaeon]